MSIDVQYFADSDALSLWTGAPAAEAEEIAEGVIVDFDAEGNVVGFTLERASALLQPMLDAARKASQWSQRPAAAPRPKRHSEPSDKRFPDYPVTRIDATGAP